MVTEERNGYRIVDRRGDGRPDNSPARAKASGGNGFFQTPRNTQQLDYYRPRYFGEVDPAARFDDYDWREVLQFSRELFAQLGDLAYAIIQKNLYAVGDAWRPQYVGKNKAWGDEATEWLQEVWFPQCSLRGSTFDFTTELFLSGVAWDVDGDDLMLFGVDDTGFPRLKFYPSHCIGSRGSSSDEAKGGWADGAKVYNGVLTDRQGNMVGVRVLGDRPEDDEDVRAGNCQFLFEPEWRSFKRGIPRIARGLMDSFDIQDIDTFLKRGVKLEQSIGLRVSTETGEPPPGSDTIDDPPAGSEATDIKIEKRFGGEVWWTKAGANEKVEGMGSDRPHPNTEAFIGRLLRRTLLSVGWFYELVDSSAIGGANVRLVQDLARHSIFARQKTLRKRAKSAIGFAVAQAMKTGRISRNDDGIDFLRWHFDMPPQITVDSGYDEQADREGLKMGITTVAAICQKKGKWWKDVRLQRKEENKNLLADALELVSESGGKITFREALDLIQMNTANGRPPELQAGSQGDKKT